MNSWEILYEYDSAHPHNAGFIVVRPRSTRAHARTHKPTHTWTQMIGFTLVALALGGMIGPLTPEIRMEAGYALRQFNNTTVASKSLPRAVPVVFDPLVTPDGASIDPINTEFSVIIPKIGVNAAVAENVDPANADEYLEALKVGVAHANTSFLPNQDGTTYLFSHSTNFDWFVRDINAVFYLLKNLEKDDKIVLFYQGKRYTYRLTEKKVVSPKDVSYLVPETGKKRLILQTCWPPGSTTQRLLIFADLVEDQGESI